MNEMVVHPDPCPICGHQVTAQDIGEELFLRCIVCHDTRLEPNPRHHHNSGDHADD